ncbi:MAG: ubiquinol-cytochrome C chaperone family protein [Hyphomonadaceae bacterium]|nr:ubiquinol-cytochrome C chaperone family protein [Hyphomonadaceae bacterium]
MSVFGLFGKSAANEAADRILKAVSGAARAPALFAEGRAPDTLTGRFEVVTVFAVLALDRLRAAPEADRLAQAFTDKLFRFFDAGLREAGVGDLSVAKRMKALAGAFYGRLGAYRAGFTDAGAFADALSRNIWNTPYAAFAPALAQQLLTLRERLRDAPLTELEAPSTWVIDA